MVIRGCIFLVWQWFRSAITCRHPDLLFIVAIAVVAMADRFVEGSSSAYIEHAVAYGHWAFVMCHG